MKFTDICCAVLLILSLLLSHYGQSYKSKPITQKAATPVAFFPANANIADFPLGNMTSLRDIIIDDELIFIMFYAPWSRRSKSARAAFLKAANVLLGQIRFLSINCFLHSGQCHHMLKLTSYPQFYAYHTILHGYRFPGAHTAAAMVTFLERFLHPLMVLHNQDQASQFTKEHDNTVIGYFDFGNVTEPHAYLQFYYAALRTTALDIMQPVRFAVISHQSLAATYELTKPTEIVFIRRFDTKLKYAGNMTSTDIRAWVEQHKVTSSLEWLSPPHGKSSLLSSHMGGDATLFLFTNNDPLWRLHPYFYLLRDIADAYNDCHNETSERRGKHSYATAERFFINAIKLCNRRSYGRDKYSNFMKFCQSPSHKFIRKPCENCQQRKVSTGPGFGDYIVTVNVPRNVCVDAHHLKVCCDCQRIKCEGCVRFCNDPDVREACERRSEHVCRRLQLQPSVLPAAFASRSSLFMLSPPDLKSIHGLACRTNRTLNFVAIDAKQHEEIMRSYTQTSGTLDADSPHVVILDLSSEAHYRLNSTITPANIVDFIKNYTASDLSPTLHGQTTPFATSLDPTAPARSTLHVTELTSRTFLSSVMDNDKDVLVYMYSRWCAFCYHDNHMYLSLAEYFRHSPSILFTRIDADRNQLPWQFTAYHYPTIIFFPRKRKSESIVYPSDLNRSLPNLVKFVLRHTSQAVRLKTAASICSKTCIAKNRRQVFHIMKSLRKHIRWLIGQISLKLRHLQSLRSQYKHEDSSSKESIPRSQLFYIHRQLISSRRQYHKVKFFVALLTSDGAVLKNFVNIQRYIYNFGDKTQNKFYVESL